MKKIIDLSRELSQDSPCYPGDPCVKLEQTATTGANGFSDFRLETGMHVSTHIDGPMHMTASGQFISGISPESFIGPGKLVDARGAGIIEPGPDWNDLLREGDIVLFYTGWGAKYGTLSYYQGFPELGLEAARFLAGKKIRMAGFDTPSVDRPPHPVHKVLLEAGVLIAENLDLTDELISFLELEIIALPMKIRSDSAPARIIARM